MSAAAIVIELLFVDAGGWRFEVIDLDGRRIDVASLL